MDDDPIESAINLLLQGRRRVLGKVREQVQELHRLNTALKALGVEPEDETFLTSTAQEIQRDEPLRVSVRSYVQHLMEREDRPWFPAELAEQIGREVATGLVEITASNVGRSVRSALWSLAADGVVARMTDGRSIAQKWLGPDSSWLIYIPSPGEGAGSEMRLVLNGGHSAPEVATG